MHAYFLQLITIVMFIRVPCSHGAQMKTQQSMSTVGINRTRTNDETIVRLIKRSHARLFHRSFDHSIERSNKHLVVIYGHNYDYYNHIP